MKVSVIMLTYNHDKYINQAILGILTQQANFEIELIIADDCSTDNTKEIVDNYSSEIKSDKIKYFKHPENIGIQANFNFAINQSSADYVALCEGDDFWTDPLKLQKQIDFLEANSASSFCWTRFHTFDEKNDKISLDLNDKHFVYNEEYIDFNFEKSFNGWHMGTQTLVFRHAFFDKNVIKKFKYFRDAHLIAQLLKKGDGACLNFVSATYRLHGSGIHTKVSEYDGYKIGYLCNKEIYKDNKTELFVKKKYLLSFQNFIMANINEGYFLKAFRLNIRLLFTQWKLIPFLKNIFRIFKKALQK